MTTFRVELKNPNHLHFIIFVPAADDTESKTVAEQRANGHPSHSQYGPWTACSSELLH